MLKLTVLLCLTACLLGAAGYPASVAGDWVVHDFRFHDGSTLHHPPDAPGAGKSSRPSDGLRTRFPNYTYADIVRTGYRLVTEHLGVKHLRVIIGTSAGGMQTWMWGEMYPEFMDALMPLASMPVEMSGRNWMRRRMPIEAIRNDPEWNGGNCQKQPAGFHRALLTFQIATTGGSGALLQSEPEAGGIKRVKHGRYILIPAGIETHGHATTGNAALWRGYLAELLKSD